jgi:hypothetical protein
MKRLRMTWRNKPQFHPAEKCKSQADQPSRQICMPTTAVQMTTLMKNWFQPQHPEGCRSGDNGWLGWTVLPVNSFLIWLARQNVAPHINKDLTPHSIFNIFFQLLSLCWWISIDTINSTKISLISDLLQYLMYWIWNLSLSSNYYSNGTWHMQQPDRLLNRCLCYCMKKWWDMTEYFNF